MGGIYKITNALNEMIYVGSTRNFSRRKYLHFRSLEAGDHANFYLQKVFNEVGIEGIYFEVLEVVGNSDQLISREKYWIEYLNCFSPTGYNIQVPGEFSGQIKIAGNIKLPRKHSAETRMKIGKGNKGKTRSEEVKARISQTLRGRTLSEEHIKKVADAHRGKPLSQEHREKISRSNSKYPNELIPKGLSKKERKNLRYQLRNPKKERPNKYSKYDYPEDCITPEDRKRFRIRTRRMLAKTSSALLTSSSEKEG